MPAPPAEFLAGMHAAADHLGGLLRAGDKTTRDELRLTLTWAAERIREEASRMKRGAATAKQSIPAADQGALFQCLTVDDTISPDRIV